jgi:hypothetical protein
MQNIDYSRRLRGSVGYSPASEPAESNTFHHYHSNRESQKPRSAFFLLIGAILLFTSGMVVGIQMNQKEKGFQSNQEKSFANVGKGNRNQVDRIASSDVADEPNTQSRPSQDSFGSDTTAFPTHLKFPPKNDQINYMVQIGNFSPEEAVQIGRQMMMAEPSLQGRIFRTSTGKLYAGYFYRMEDAREALDKITSKLPNATDAMVKTIRF